MFIIFCWSFQRIIRIKPAEDSHYNTFKILLLTPGRLEEEIFTGQKLNHKLLQEIQDDEEYNSNSKKKTKIPKRIYLKRTRIRL